MIGDSPHVIVMLPRLFSISSLAASRYRLLAASHGLSKRGKGPKALRSGVAVIGDDACCVCAAGDCTLLGDHGLWCDGHACIVAPFVCHAGVADGVGGWRDKGVDPSQFTQLLMLGCADELQKGRQQDPSIILEEAHRSVLQSKDVAVGEFRLCL